jgi:hypothetical protein
MKNSPFVLFLLFIGVISFTPITTPIYAQGDCFASPGGSQDINTRGGPGTDYARVDFLTVNDSIIVTGQRAGADGFVWWRVFSGGWVRSDVVVLSGNCNEIPSVEPPPDYCTTRTELSERPVLSGEELRLATERFVVHYTLTGEDAITEEVAQIAADTLEESLSVQVDDMGWPMTPPDCGEGGDERFDLYVYQLEEGYAGFAIPNHIIGDNPLSPEVEQYAAYGHLEIANDFSLSADPIGLMKATIAHEIHHNIQFTFDVGDAFRSLDEAGATWMETQVFPQNQDAMQYVDEYLYFPDLCLGYNEEDNTRRIYGEWLIIDSLVKDYGANSLHEVFWRYRADYEGMETFYLAIESLDDDASNVIFRAGVRNLLRSYTLSSESMYRVYVEGVINGVGDYAPRRDGIQELGVEYLKIDDLGQYNYSLSGNNLFLAIVGINGAQADIFYIGDSGTVDLSSYDDAYAMILSLTRRSDDESCRFEDWQISVSEGTGSLVNPDTEVWDATFFEPPVQSAGTERYIGVMDDTSDVAEYTLFLQAGDVLNVYAGATNGGIVDMYIFLADATQTTLLVEDDDSGGGVNSFFTYTIEESGEYILAATPIVTLDVDSDFEVIIGINEDIGN